MLDLLQVGLTFQVLLANFALLKQSLKLSEFKLIIKSSRYRNSNQK